MAMALNILISVLPVLLFLGGLLYLDSYKLVRFRAVAMTIGVGCLVAGLCSLFSLVALAAFGLERGVYAQYMAPALEEGLKALYVFLLIRASRIGFMVDAAILGFGVGAGFAVVENLYYLQSIPDAPLHLWVIRGFGTAMMHGGSTAIVAIISKTLADRRSAGRITIMIPGLVVGVLIHALFNHFFLSPSASTAVILVMLPILLAVVFAQSEQATRSWLGVGFDTDRELLEMITTGNLGETKVGVYLQSLQARFPGEVVADMLCLLRIHLELAIGAKGILLMREAGFRVQPDPEIREKFSELRYLEKNIGPTGTLMLAPFLHMKSHDLWQLHMLGAR